MRLLRCFPPCSLMAGSALLLVLLFSVSTRAEESAAIQRFNNVPPPQVLPPPPVACPPVPYPPEYRPPGIRPPHYNYPPPVIYVNERERIYYVDQPAPATAPERKESPQSGQALPSRPQTTTTYSEVQCAGDMVIRTRPDGTPVMEYVGPSGSCR